LVDGARTSASSSAISFSRSESVSDVVGMTPRVL
jgi:hypothetical protein